MAFTVTRKNPYSQPKSVNVTPTSHKESIDRGRVARAIESAHTAATPPSPSLAAATAHEVDPRHYSIKEQAAAEGARGPYVGDAAGINPQASNALSFVSSTGFPGFPTLALLAQLPEYRSMYERFADECVKSWGKVVSTGAATDEHMAAIETELRRIDLRAVVRTLIVQEQTFGRAHACINLNNDKAHLPLPLVLKPFTVKKASFTGVRPVEAYWVTPNNYNSIDPSAPDFYKPSTWWMLGQEIHATRLFTLVSRPVPDLLKPAYSFAGLSITQLAMPYVDNWLRTRQSVSDTVKQFSVSGVATDMQQFLAPGGTTDLNSRAELINAYRDNRNILFMDKMSEEFFQFNTPLSGLDALQAQAQEQMSSVSHIPLVVLLGITPNGLNASSEGEIRVFYDFVLGYLNATILPLILYVLKISQLSLFGEIDDTISWEWFPLYQETRKEAAETAAKQAETDERYVEMGALTPEKIAARLAADPKSIYAGVAAQPSLDETPDDDIQAITEHIVNIEFPSTPSEQNGQAGAPVDTTIDPLTQEASAISTPHSREVSNVGSDPGRPNPRKKMGV